MEYILQKIFALFVIVLGPFLALFDLPGNTIVLLTAIGLGIYYDPFWQPELFCLMLIIYALGEMWEFIISLFGIRKEKASWFACFVIGIGGFCGAVCGTMVLPVLGSFIGGVIGAFITAFCYEYINGKSNDDALHLAWASAKMRFLAILGKFCAGIALGCCLFKLVFL
ncbi:MAG: DUF456 domain-containing protein [Phascolarctobacterium sp.]|nr:DUF456 domain-containing protein [Phascolarctobacterium sp.]